VAVASVHHCEVARGRRVDAFVNGLYCWSLLLHKEYASTVDTKHRTFCPFKMRDLVGVSLSV
jgi:hypothetical protein